jgi:hypothetical protein
LGGHWHTFDARHNRRRIGRSLIARGRDAGDVPITTVFGQHLLETFSVITEEIDPGLPAYQAAFFFGFPEVAPVTEMADSILFGLGRDSDSSTSGRCYTRTARPGLAQPKPISGRFWGGWSGFVAIVLVVSRVEAIANAVSKNWVHCHLQARRIRKFPVNLAVLL